MSVVNQFGKLFNRKPEESDTGLGADVIGGGQNVLTTGSIEGNTMRESYQTDAMNSVQGDPDGVSSELSTTDADEDLISLPLLGRQHGGWPPAEFARIAGHWRGAAGADCWLGASAGGSFRPAAGCYRSVADAVAAACQVGVSQALVGSPQAFPDVVESSGVLARNVRALNSGDSELGVQSLGEQFKSDLEGRPR
jgi:twitching motility protein PilJ